jgi:hypothetical protein
MGKNADIETRNHSRHITVTNLLAEKDIWSREEFFSIPTVEEIRTAQHHLRLRPRPGQIHHQINVDAIPM